VVKGEYNNTICKERHEAIKEKEQEQDRRLDKHGNRLDLLEQHRSRVEVQIENLIAKINDLIGLMKWFLLGLLGSGGGFIVWQIKEMINR
jgi:hypothetical protein